MKTTSFRRAFVPTVAALALGASLVACGGDDATGGTGGSGAGGGDVSNLSGELIGGGASSQEAAQNAWIAGFTEKAPNVTVNYSPEGSGTGREQFIAGGYKFAGTDAYLTDDEKELSKATQTCGGHPIEIPNYVSPIAIVYNLEGVDSLQLSPEVLADIFAGKIKKWNDPAIAKDNPDAKLPGTAINPVHRADESGTTENFQDYLDAAAPKNWTYGVEETWPKPAGGEAAKGTSGVIQAVGAGNGSIGYADASQAGELGQAKIKVGNEYVEPSADAAAKILEVSPRVKGRPAHDMAFDLDHTTKEAGVYPIVLTSYMLACQQYGDQQTADLVKGYLSYVVSPEGQEFATSEAGNAPLSEKLTSEVEGIVSKISAKK